MNKFKAFAPTVQLSSHAALRLGGALLITLFVVLLAALTKLVAPVRAAGQAHALFDVNTEAGTPFPSDLFTLADSSQNTGLRVNLPKPDCAARPSDCEDLDVLDTLDGFNLLPRLSIPFDSPIDVATATSESIFLISLGSTLPDGDIGGHVVGINRIVWDSATNTLHAEADELLDQHTRYALVVTNRLRDTEGMPIAATEAFRRFRHDLNFGQAHDRDLKDYRKALLDALEAARAVGVQESDIVSASVFTTLSATASLEQIRDQIKSDTPAPAQSASRSRRVFLRSSTLPASQRLMASPSARRVSTRTCRSGISLR